jgi:hypothetical protein
VPQPVGLSTPTMLDAPTIVFGHGNPWTEGAAEAVRLARASGPA